MALKPPRFGQDARARRAGHRHWKDNASAQPTRGPSADNLITLAEAAVRLHLPYYAAHRLALAGDLGPVQRVGGRYWFLDPEAVQSFIDHRAKSATLWPLPTDDASSVGA